MKMVAVSLHRFGNCGVKRAIAFSPALPKWDNGSSYLELPSALERHGYALTIYDTLSLLTSETRSLADLADAWAIYLAGEPPPDLVIGSALGGSLALTLLAREWHDSVRRALLFSPPIKSDDALNTQLQKIVDLANNGSPYVALAALEIIVAPSGCKEDLIDIARHIQERSFFDGYLEAQQGISRLAKGLTILRDIDLTGTLSAYAGTIYSFVGNRSQLVRPINVPPISRNHTSFLIDSAGMRTLADNWQSVNIILERFFTETK